MVNIKNNKILYFFDKLKNYFRRIIIQTEATPKQMALSFAVGLAVALSPLIGLHTCITIIICIIFNKLHRPLMLLTCYLNNPWTMLPVASVSVLVGNVLMGHGVHLCLDDINWHEIGLHSFLTQKGLNNMYLTLKPVILPYLLGGFALSVFALPLGYYIMLKIINYSRNLENCSAKTESSKK